MLAWLLVFVAVSLGNYAQAQDAVCAQVKIEIKQKVSLERQAFDAVMRIENGLDSSSIQNVGINLTFQDQAGNAVVASSDPSNTSASFFVTVSSLAGIGAIDGTGSVAPKTTGEIHWLILPAAGTGGTQLGKMYFVGATLTYSLAGTQSTVTVTPDFITVKPQPLLALDYFLVGDVYADDPFTPQVEPPVPFTFGVRIKNVGGGTAAKTIIESAQPQIVDNQQGLAIAFQIVNAYVNDQPAGKTLQLDFGDIGASTSKVGRWDMVTSLSGRFTDFQAGFTHADSLGGALTSLIQGVATHQLVHDVVVDLPGRDSVHDFLALDGNVLRVYESDGIDGAAIDQSANAQLQAGTAGQYNLTFPATTGLAYVKLTDPFAGQAQPGAVVRSDGKTLSSTNVWLSKKRNADLSWSYFVNFFDVNTTGSYNVALSGTTAYASLAGAVYNDANANGQRDAGESGIGSAAVTLTGTDNQGANVNTTGYSDSTGAFSFVQLTPGTYTLQVAAVQGFTDGSETVGSAGGTAGTASITNIVLGTGATANNYAFAKRSNSGNSADVGVTMTVSTANAKVGETVAFHVTATNGGPSTATTVVVTDHLPSGLAFISGTASSGSYNNTSGVWAPSDLATGGSATLDLTARVTAIGVLSNTATIASNNGDPNASNNTASATVTSVAANSTVTTGVVASGYRVPAGGTAVLLVNASNYGPDPANGTTITLTPSNLTILSGAPSVGTYDAVTATWSIDSLAKGASATLLLRANNVGNMSGVSAVVTQVNGASPGSPQTDYVKFNPVDCDCPDLGLHIATSAQSAAVGASVDWLITATNHGPNPAIGALATITLPTSVSLTSVGAGTGAYDAGSSRWSIGTLHPGDTATLTLHTQVNATGAAVMTGLIQSVNSPNLTHVDLTSADDDAFNSVNGSPISAGLRIAHSVDKLKPGVGETVTFSSTVSNEGPLPASGITVLDLLPSGLSFVSANGSQGAHDAGTGIWSVGSIASQATATLSIQATVTTTSTLASAALVYADQIDGASVDNVARVDLNLGQADTSVAVAADNLTPNVGQTVALTVTARNLGPDAATGLILSAPIPQGLTLTGSSAAQGTYDAATGLWKIGTLAANTSSTLNLVATVNVHTPISIVTRVHETITHDGNTANNEAVLILNSLPGAILGGTVTTDKTTYNTAENATVNVVVTNTGVVDAQGVNVNVVVRDTSNVQVHGSSGTIATLAVGATSNLSFNFALGADAPGTYTVTVQGADIAGDLLPAVTASYTLTVASPVAVNVALASAGSVALASSRYSAGYPAAAVIDNERAGTNAGSGGYWNDGTANAWPDWVQINFNGSKTIDRVVVYSVQDNYQNPVEPTDTMTFSLYGLTDFAVQGWNGSTGWVTLATVSGNNLVKRPVTFAAFTTDRIRVYVTNTLDTWSRITEIEAWGTDPSGPPSTTLSSSANPLRFGSTVTLTATVVGTNPTGNVSFTDGVTSIGTCAAVALAGGGNRRTAACNVASFSVGTHNIVASYGGNVSNPASSSSALSLNVVSTNATNVALASVGGLAHASSAYDTGYPAAAVIDNERAGSNAGNGGYWNDGTPNAWPDWLQVDFNGPKSIDRVVVYSVQDNYLGPVEPTDTMTFSLYGITDFAVQGWNDTTGWTTLATVSSNNLVKRAVTFPAFTTKRIRIQVTNALQTWSRIAEIEAWGIDVPSPSVNVALAGAGAVASASSVHSDAYPVAALIDNERAGTNAGSGGYWNDATPDTWPDWVQINFNGTRTIDHVVVYSVQDDSLNPVEPTNTMPFSFYGLTDFIVQGWDASTGWVTLATVSDNYLIKRSVSFSAFTTDRIRIQINNAFDTWSRITEVEAWSVP